MRDLPKSMYPHVCGDDGSGEKANEELIATTLHAVENTLT